MGLANYFQVSSQIKSQEDQNLVEDATEIIDKEFVSYFSRELLCYSLGDAFYMQGKYSQACKFYKRIVLSRNLISERFGICLMATGYYSEALSCFEFGLSQSPNNNLKWIYFVVFNWVKGETCYDGSVERHFNCRDCGSDIRKRAKFAVYLIKTL